MPIYNYKALTLNGEISGTISTNSMQDAIIKLKEQNFNVIFIEENNNIFGSNIFNKDILNKDITFFNKKINNYDLAIFCKQLHTMLSSGLPIIQSMDVLAKQSENIRIRKASYEVSQDIRKGNLFSIALKNHTKVFPPLLVNMIKSGEITGNLDEVILSLSAHYENEAKISSKIKMALLYPKFLMGAASVVIIAMLVFVVPKFIEMFSNSTTPIPAITQSLIFISNFITNNFIILVIIITTLYFLTKQLLQRENVKYKYEKFLLNVPRLGDTIKKLISTRFSKTMATLLASGIPIVNALEASAKVTGNTVLIKEIDVVIDEIQKGHSLSKLLNDVNIFPPILISMISIGEESGNLDGMFLKVSTYFDSELDENIKKIVSLIEPVMILILGIFMAYIIIAMYLPILNMSTTI